MRLANVISASRNLASSAHRPRFRARIPASRASAAAIPFGRVWHGHMNRERWRWGWQLLSRFKAGCLLDHLARGLGYQATNDRSLRRALCLGDVLHKLALRLGQRDR